jgi:hypothetical protein
MKSASRAQRRSAKVFYRGILASALVLVTCCVAQRVTSKFDDSSRLILHQLNDTHASGSLVYSATCSSHQGRFPIVPHVHFPSSSGPLVDVLRNMFAGDSNMQATQEPGGMVRMAEANVPSDILEVKIHYISFHATPSDALPTVGGPRLAMMRVLGTPEVKTFMEGHDITTGAGRLEGTYPKLPDVPGELSDVTVLQALDYILKVFPGYWVYENCTTPDGRRSVNFDVYSY